MADDVRLGPRAREVVATAELALVSTASVWEMSINGALGKLDAPDDLARQVQRHRFTILPIHFDHALRVGSLPSIHGDPFDRMLVAQAQVEDVTIVSRDRTIARYEVAVIDATQ